MIRSKRYTGVYRNILENKDIVYYITYKHKGKKEWVKMGSHAQGVREAFCSKQRADILLKLRLGDDVPAVLKNKTTFSLHQIAVEFFEKKEYKSKTYKTLWGRYINHTYPTLGELNIDAVDFDKCQALFLNKKRDDTLSDKSVQLIMEQLGSIINYAISCKYFNKENPCKKIKIKKIDNARTRYLTLKEIDTLVDKVKTHKDVYLFVLLSLSTGARFADVYNMKKKQFNLENRTVTIKNSKGNSTYQAFLTTRVLPYILLDDLELNDSLFNVSERVIQRYMKKVLDELFNKGLDVKDSKNRVVIHTLRHTFASQLAIAGTPIFTIQKLLDHKNIEDTLRYAKLSPDNGRDFVEKLF